MKSKILSFLYDAFKFFIGFVIIDKIGLGFWASVGILLAVIAVFNIAETVIEKSKVKKTAQTAPEQEYTSNENN